MDILLVDGYNIIGAWPELRKLKMTDFQKARSLLIEKMAEYQAYTGYRVIVVFDAYHTKAKEKKYIDQRVEVVFTGKNETADERIEKLASTLKDIRTKIYVATSDSTEQWTIFSQGALRVSARELLTDVNAIQTGIENNIKRTQEEKPLLKIPLSAEIEKIFEKWRREK